MQSNTAASASSGEGIPSQQTTSANVLRQQFFNEMAAPLQPYAEAPREDLNLHSLASTAVASSSEEAGGRPGINRLNLNRFPRKLLDIIEDPTEESIFWNAKGTHSGIVPEIFVKNVLPVHFPGSKFDSFTRKLSRWGFQRAVEPSFNQGVLVYEHNLLKRGQEHAIHQMTSSAKARAIKKAANATERKKKQQAAKKAPPQLAPPQAQAPAVPGRMNVASSMNSTVSTSYEALQSELLARQRLLDRERQLTALLSSTTSTAPGHSLLEQGSLSTTNHLFNRHASLSTAASHLDLSLLHLHQQGHSGGDLDIYRIYQLRKEEQERAFIARHLQLREQLLAREHLLSSGLRLPHDFLSLTGGNSSISHHATLQPNQVDARLRSLFDSTSSSAGAGAALGDVGLFPRPGDATLAPQTSAFAALPLEQSLPQPPAPVAARQKEEETGEEDESVSSGFQPSCFQEQQWDLHYKQLCRYSEEHGSCHVPQHTSPDLKLARWVKRQRYQYKLLKGGKPSNITPQRVKALERIGFVWDAHSTVWEERVRELKAFKKEHGHCSVPTTHTENRKLAAWVKCQRRQYKLRLDGKANNMTTERIQELENLGFEWLIRCYRSKDTTDSEKGGRKKDHLCSEEES